MKFALRERTVNALGTTVTVRDLTIGESLALQNVKEDEMLFHIIEKAVVKPKLTVKQIKDLPASKMKDLTIIANAIQGTEDDK